MQRRQKREARAQESPRTTVPVIKGETLPRAKRKTRFNRYKLALPGFPRLVAFTCSIRDIGIKKN